jgi:transposase-like protein
MPTTTNLPSTLAKLKELASSDLPEAMRQQVTSMFETLMEDEVQALTGAALHEKQPDRKAFRNGYRVRKLETRLGSLEIHIPRLRTGSYMPSFIEPRCRVHESLVGLVTEAYTLGVSTRKIDDLCQALDIAGLSKGAVSRMLTELDAGIEAWSQRPLGACPYVFLDARYEQVRDNRRIVKKAVLVAVGVNAEGGRELLGFTVAAGEEFENWKGFFDGLLARGLTGTQLVISDAHAGLRRAIEETFPRSSWQRCTIHLARNLMAAVSQRHRAHVGALYKTILACPDIDQARRQLKVVLETLEDTHPKAAAILEAAGEDFLAFLHCPGVHQRKIHSTNLVERLNREIKRRTRVVSIFPNDASLTRLVGAILERDYEQWKTERYMSSESMTTLQRPTPHAA